MTERMPCPRCLKNLGRISLMRKMYIHNRQRKPQRQEVGLMCLNCNALMSLEEVREELQLSL